MLGWSRRGIWEIGDKVSPVIRNNDAKLKTPKNGLVNINRHMAQERPSTTTADMKIMFHNCSVSLYTSLVWVVRPDIKFFFFFQMNIFFCVVISIFFMMSWFEVLFKLPSCSSFKGVHSYRSNFFELEVKKKKKGNLNCLLLMYIEFFDTVNINKLFFFSWGVG